MVCLTACGTCALSEYASVSTYLGTPPSVVSWMVDVDKLPPTQQLVLDVLAARYRLGETMWTFSTNCQSAINALVVHGLAGPMHVLIDPPLRALLTAAI